MLVEVQMEIKHTQIKHLLKQDPIENTKIFLKLKIEQGF